MDSRELALLGTIRAAPADDGPRLVYADWLEEQGRCERAEFIRIQIERSHLDTYDPRQVNLVRRERELIHGLSAAWSSAELRELARYFPPSDEPPFEPLDPSTTRELPPDPRWYFQRGFPAVEISPTQFLQNADWLLNPVSLLQVHIGGDSYRELMERYRSPDASPNRAEIFMRMLTTPSAANAVTRLMLTEPGDWPQFLDLARDLRLIELQSASATLEPRHMLESARHAALANLAELRLSGHQSPSESFRALAGWQCLPHLRRLELRSNRITPETVAILLKALDSSRIQSLDLSDNPLGDEGIRAVSLWPGLANVRELRLEGCGIGGRGAVDLANSPYLASLTQLGLQRNDIRGRGLAVLTNPGGASWLKRLRRLDLCGNRIGDVGARQLLVALPLLQSLRRLYLSHDRDDLSQIGRRWLSDKFGVRLGLDWFEQP